MYILRNEELLLFIKLFYCFGLRNFGYLLYFMNYISIIVFYLVYYRGRFCRSRD